MDNLKLKKKKQIGGSNPQKRLFMDNKIRLNKQTKNNVLSSRAIHNVTQ